MPESHAVPSILAYGHNSTVLIHPHPVFAAVLRGMRDVFGGTIQTRPGRLLWPVSAYSSPEGITAERTLLDTTTTAWVEDPTNSAHQAHCWAALHMYSEKAGSLAFTHLVLGPFPTGQPASGNNLEVRRLPESSKDRPRFPLRRSEAVPKFSKLAYIDGRGTTLDNALVNITTNWHDVFPEGRTNPRDLAAGIIGLREGAFWPAMAAFEEARNQRTPVQAAQLLLTRLTELGPEPANAV